MNVQQKHVLSLRETDVQGAVSRCCGSEQLYTSCLKEFLNDTTMTELSTAIANQMWDEAFTAAHALKGLAGNMGFIPLMHATGQLVILIRGGRLNDMNAALEEVNSSYRDITDAIMQFFAISDIDREEVEI